MERANRIETLRSPLVLALGTSLVFLGIFWPQWQFLFSLWHQEEDYQHGLITLPAMIWLAWQFRQPLQANISTPNYWALALLLPGVAVMPLLEPSLAILLLPILGSLFIWLVFGFQAARSWALLFGILYLALPIWSLLRPFLQELTVLVVQNLLSLFGYSVLIEGFRVTIPYGHFFVETGCSGLSYFIAGVASTLLFAVLITHQWRHRFLIIVLGTLIALLANWIRVTIVIVAGYETQMAHPLVHDHLSLGWYVFAALYLPFFALGRWLTPISSVAKSINSNAPTPWQPALLAAGAGITTTLVLLAGVINWDEKQAQDKFYFEQNSQIANHLRYPAQRQSWHPRFQGAVAQTAWQWRIQDRDVVLKRGLFHSKNSEPGLFQHEAVLPYNDHYFISYSQPAKNADFRELILEGEQGKKFLWWRKYTMGKFVSPSRNLARLMSQARRFIFLYQQEVTIWAAPCEGHCEGARKALLEATQLNRMINN